MIEKNNFIQPQYPLQSQAHVVNSNKAARRGEALNYCIIIRIRGGGQ